MKLLALLSVLVLTSTAFAQQPRHIEHVFVAGGPDSFCGWPANNGVWQWDNEILVGFTEGEFIASESHNLKGIQHSKFARSLDGGDTWKVFDPENFLDDDNIQWKPKGKTRLDTALSFTDLGFVLRVFASGYHGNDDPDAGFYYSYDRGATWKGPHHFGGLNALPEIRGKVLTPRTDYIATSDDHCFWFITVDEPLRRIACIETSDGGLTFDFVSWVTPATESYSAIMPQTIKLSNGDYLLAFRRINKPKTPIESGIDFYISKDNCKTWNFLSTIVEFVDNSNPPAIVEMADGRICCIYGDRDKEVLAGKYSDDKGATWGDEFVIRDEYKSVDGWADMGYPRLVQRPDGKLVAMYYWASAEHPQQHIACSIW